MNTVAAPKSFAEHWLLMPKALYFSLTVALYSTNSVMGFILKDSWKFNYSQTGFVYALQIVNFFGAMIWTNLADRTGRHRAIIVLTSVASVIFYALLMLPKILGWKFENFFLKYGFPTLMMTMMWIFQSSLFPLTDSAVIIKLSKDPSLGKEQFGYQRLFGSFGHAAGTMLGSAASDLPTSKEFFQVMVSIVCSAIFCFFVFLGVPTISETLKGKSHGHHGKDEKSEKKDTTVDVGMAKAEDTRSPLVRLLSDPSFLLFILFVLSAGLLANTMTIYQPLYTEEIMKISKLTVSTLKIPAVCSEIIVWLISKPLMGVVGKYWMLMFSQFAGIIRIFGYQFADESRFWLLVILEATKGINSGFIVSAAVQIAAELAPAGCGSTAQGLFSGVYKGAGFLVTGVVCGLILLFNNNQIKHLFLLVGFTSLLFTTIFFLKFLIIDRSIGFPCFPSRPRVIKA